MKGSIIAFDPCPHCENHDMCSKCELTFRRSGVIANPCEWISVRTWGKLRIQPSVRVLCACKQKSGKVFVKEGYCELWGSNVVWKIPGSIDAVTHWMPMPEAPKGGE